MDVIVKVKKVCPWVYIFKKRFEQPSRTDLLYMEILKDESIILKKEHSFFRCYGYVILNANTLKMQTL